MIQITKGEFITNILVTSKNIAAWKAFRTANIELSIAVNEAWESSNNVILDSAFVQGLVNALVPSVLDQGALDRMNAEISKQTAAEIKYYRIPVGAVPDISAWISENVQGLTNPFAEAGGMIYFSALSASVPAERV